MKLDKIDLKILKHLDSNPKITTTQLAKSCLISQQVADYRVKSLKEKEVIIGFPTMINFFNLGYSAYLLLLKTDPLPDDKKHLLNIYLKKSTNIYSAKTTGGNYDYAIIFLSKSYIELDTHLNSLFSEFDFFIDYEIYPITEINYYKHKMLNPHNLENITIAEPLTLSKLDDIDYSILANINENCRHSNLEIGKKLGLNYNTIKNRIDSLTEKKVIVGQTITINPDSLGLAHFNLLISLKNYSKKDDDKFISFCNNHENILYSTHLLGGIWAFHIGVQTKSLETLQKILATIRSIFKNIDNISVVPVFDEIKKNTFPVQLDHIPKK
jgi:DNA-binding Lrp family transcriptional regulator